MTAVMRRIAVIALAVLTTSCVGAHAAQLRSEPSSDVDALAAALRVIQEGRPRNISVDIRPIRVLPPSLLVMTETRLEVPQAALDARAAVVRGAGFPLGDALVPDRCAGVMVPGDGLNRQGCPKLEAYVIATAAAPRYDSTATGGPDSRPAGWYLRVLATSIGPDGFASRSDDFLMERAGGRWTVVRQYRVGYVE